MNAVEIITLVRAHGADIALEDDVLVLRGRGSQLPADLQAAVREHKAELMVALGAPFDRSVASILQELRPNLPGALKTLEDSKLLAMVNWTIMAAWLKTLRQVEFER